MTVIYNESYDSSADDGALHSGVSKRGQEITHDTATLYDGVPNEVKIQLRKHGSPSGTLTVGLDSQGVADATIGTMSLSGISTSYTEYTFTNSAITHQMQVGDFIYIEVPGGLHFDNRIEMKVKDTDVDTGTVHNYYISSWNQAEGYDTIAMTVTDNTSSGGSSSSSSSETGASFNPEILQILQIGPPK